MRSEDFLKLHWFVELIVDFLLWNAFLYASIGLCLACGLTLAFDLESTALFWGFAMIGFAYGVRIDIAEFRESAGSALFMLVCFGLTIGLIAGEVMLVLRYLPGIFS